MNLELKARITEANLGVVDINGYKYNKHKMSLVKISDVTVLLPVFNDICVGDCFQSTDWRLTCIDTETKPTEVMVRVDSLELQSPDDFECSEYLNTKVVGLYCISDKCVLTTKGPDSIPFFTATLKVKNSFNKAFDLFLLGFGKQAKAMSTIKRASIVECTVTVKRRRRGKGWEFAVLTIIEKGQVQ